MRYTDEELLTELKNEFETTQITPTYGKKRKHHINTYIRRFGSWSNALQLVGINTDKRQSCNVITKTCEHCKTKFKTKKYKEARYCSVKCSNESRRNPSWKPREKRADWLLKIREQANYKLITYPFEELSDDLKRKRIILEQNNTCNKCGISEWQQQAVILEIDHKDGNRSNNIRDNMEGLCPNCHSLTSTWRGRNKMNNNVTNEELLKSLLSEDHTSIRQALLAVGLAAKGGNYKRALKLLERNLFITVDHSEVSSTMSNVNISRQFVKTIEEIQMLE